MNAPAIARTPQRARQRRIRLPVLVSGLFLALITDTITFADRIVYGEWQGKTGDKLTQSLNVLMIIAASWLFWRRWQSGGRLLLGEKLLLALCVFLFASVLWSVDPQTSGRRAFLYSAAMLGAMGIVAALDGDEIMAAVRNICLIAAATSFVLFFLAPAYVGGFDGRDFRGIYATKNTLGQVMAFGGLATLHGMRSGRQRALNIAALLLLGITIVMAKSSTSLLTFFAFCSLSVLAVLMRKGGALRMLAVFLLVIFGPVAVMIAVWPDTFLAFLDKDPTLTGRTDLWALVIGYIYQRPFLGWGFDAFWSPVNAAATQISDTLGWNVPEAHNGLLEMLIEVGIFGSAFFIFIFIRNIAIGIQCLRVRGQEIAVTLLSCGVGLLMISVSELVLVDQSQLGGMLLFICGLSCERLVAVHRRLPSRRILVR